MGNPIIKVEKGLIDVLLEIIMLIGLITLILIPLFYYKDLPEMIPTHFNAKGTPDDYNSKSMIWFLPIIGLFLAAGLFVLNKSPHVFNYPKAFTKDNASKYYRNSTRLIRVLNLTITWTFVFILYKSVQVALGHSENLGIWFLPVFLIIIFGAIIYFALGARKIA
ncbi:DUF1648 domain-containing protein [Aquimarina sp. MMG015]|uniref:DUF1648 domain-containing protein n=1 Tax=Aquimarina TaxID=290174 RepID=UPI000425242E|nr:MULTISPECIES: DUF1648 domain-containing protein [Aquimarina]MBQ4803579.1 DUF1648 domain-containing protein [Aquimarina sp. MMG015]